MTYPETLNYLFTKLPLFSKTGKSAYKKDITNTVKLCAAIGDPQLRIKTIHIAGTNGKGSVSHMLAAVFQQCGYRTGLYTSPHLKDFRERIKLNGEMISKDFVVDFVDKIRPVSEAINPSFFELTVAMALDYFAAQKTDIAIIETGLGGRLDSTNIITPVLSIITNIGYDHTDILGDTLELIAFEKAGIIKPKVPVVIGEVIPETKDVFLSKAKECESPVTFSEEMFSIIRSVYNFANLQVSLQNISTSAIQNYLLDLNGIYQQKNIRTVLTAIEILNQMGFILGQSPVSAAFSNVKKLTGLHGRWDVINLDPVIVLDVAHNEDGIKQLTDQLLLCDYNNLHIVYGMVKDKDASKVLSLLPKFANYYFTKAQVDRALPEKELIQKARCYGLAGRDFPEVNDALKAAVANSSEGDLILVCGSVFLIGEVNWP
ncbi:MAG: bifunctional folylpolyglutamate synthase/dihydrofolate synthase [Chitinophagaceae bacterium]|nr:bifunctional folylpolyglutamate synthase/dihydrofolate synthase [Chitinophagaceae bacterium]